MGYFLFPILVDVFWKIVVFKDFLFLLFNKEWSKMENTSLI